MKFHRVNTIADGYHDGFVDDISAKEFATLLEEYAEKYTLIPKFCVITNNLAWFQFAICDEDGVALFITEE